jgi:tetratricopeptide (TPR) repeat protein
LPPPVRAAQAIILVVSALAPAIAAGAQTTADDPIAQARAALEAGDLTTAQEAGERAVAAQPGDGEARLVLGMARFRAGRYPEALEAFDAAMRAEHPADTATVEFDRGAVLYKLGRFTEAERAFTTAASADTRLAAVALLDAGLAALDARDVARADADARLAATQPRAAEIEGPLGDLRREIADAVAADEQQAREAARQARAEARLALAAGHPAEAVTRYRHILRDAEARGASKEERAELRYALGTALLQAGHLIEAYKEFEAAAELAPQEGEFLFMAAETALRLDRRKIARARFEAALAAGVGPETARSAWSALDMLAPGLRSLGRGLSLDLGVGAGYDTNAAQGDTAFNEVPSTSAITEMLGNSGGGPFVDAFLNLAWHRPLGTRLFGELAYGFDQLAYLDGTLDAFDLQQHSLTATVEARLSPWVRVALTAGGDYLFAGIEQFGAFQRTLVVRPSLAIDEGERVWTSLTAEYDDKHILDEAYYYLQGTRTEVTLRQDVGRRHAHVDLAYRYRVEDLPNPEVRIGANLPTLNGMTRPCDTCQYVIPYSYRSHTALGHLDLDLPGDLLLRVSGSVEDRPYSKESYIVYIEPGLHPKVRHDYRYGAGAALALGTGRLTLRYDLLVNRSNIDSARFPLDYDEKNFTKHVISLEFAYGWTFRKR